MTDRLTKFIKSLDKKMKLQFLNKTRAAIDQEVFGKLLNKGCKVIGCNIRGWIGFSIVSDKEIAGLNLRFRGVKGPTDVLSFSYLESDEMPNDDCAGEIFISVDTAKKQAVSGLKNELSTLFVHGFLHVFGCDHNTDKEELFMNGLAAKILAD